MALPTEEWNGPGTHFLLKTCIELRKPFQGVWIGSDGGWGNMERPERAILVNCAKEKNAA